MAYGVVLPVNGISLIWIASATSLPRPVKASQTGEKSSIPAVILRRTEHRQSSLFAGPLPPPEILKQYNQLVPDAAERILTMAETQAVHRRGIERMAIQSEAQQESWSLRFGTLILVLAFILAGFIGWLGNTTGATAIVIASLSALAGVFAVGSWSRRREREKKAQIMASTPQVPASAAGSHSDTEE